MLQKDVFEAKIILFKNKQVFSSTNDILYLNTAKLLQFVRLLIS